MLNVSDKSHKAKEVNATDKYSPLLILGNALRIFNIKIEMINQN